MGSRVSSVAGRLVSAGVVGMGLLTAGLVAGCGQKGPLTLPHPPLPASSPASTPAPAS